MSKALVVLSGGQDSTTCLFWAIQQYGRENVQALTFDYGQRHVTEVAAAAAIAALAGVEHETVQVGPILAGSSPLTDHTKPLELYKDHDSMAATIGDRVELTFVPMRNALFLTLAANRAVVGGFNRVVTGVCQEDNANYPDCRRSFIGFQEATINEALGMTVRGENGWISIDTPLMDMSKAESVLFAMKIEGAYAALAYSHTAYDGSFPPTGSDHATILRAHGFEEAGVPDPLVLRCVRLGLMPRPKAENYTEHNWQGAMSQIRHDMLFLAFRGPRWWTL